MIPNEGYYNENPNQNKFLLAFLFLPHSQMLTFGVGRNKKTRNSRFGFFVAEKEGFEPPDLLQSTVFKTAAFDHSAISPMSRALNC